MPCTKGSYVMKMWRWQGIDYKFIVKSHLIPKYRRKKKKGNNTIQQMKSTSLWKDKVNIIMKRQKKEVPDIYKYSREIPNRKRSSMRSCNLSVILRHKIQRLQYNKIYFVLSSHFILKCGFLSLESVTLMRNKSFPNFNITPFKHLMLLIRTGFKKLYPHWVRNYNNVL